MQFWYNKYYIINNGTLLGRGSTRSVYQFNNKAYKIEIKNLKRTLKINMKNIKETFCKTKTTSK